MHMQRRVYIVVALLILLLACVATAKETKLEMETPTNTPELPVPVKKMPKPDKPQEKTDPEEPEKHNPLDSITQHEAPPLESIDVQRIVDLSDIISRQIEREKSALEEDDELKPEEVKNRLDSLALKQKELRALEDMVRRVFDIYQNVLEANLHKNTTEMLNIKEEGQKIIYDLQITALKAKTDLQAITKDEEKQEKAAVKQQAEDDKAKKKEEKEKEALKEALKEAAQKEKDPKVALEFDDEEEDDSPPIKPTQGKVDDETSSNVTKGTTKLETVQNAAQDIAGEIIKEVSGTADKIEGNLMDNHAFADGTKAKGATLETVLKVDESEKDEDEEGSVPLFKPLAKGRGGIVSILIDADSNQYVLSRPNDVTYYYEDTRLLSDVIIIIIFSFAGSALCNALRLPGFFGPLVAGVLLGPSAWNWIKNLVQVQTLAQLGVAFILFVLGLEFNYAKIKKVWQVSFVGTLLLFVITVTSFLAAGHFLQTKGSDAFVVGSSVFLSSTAVVLKCLTQEEFETTYGRPILGILVMQDVFLGVLLAVLPALEKSGWDMFTAVARIIGGLIVFTGIAFTITWPVHWVLKVLRTRSTPEIYLLGCITLCMVLLQVSNHLGISMELGCFVAGVIISSKQSYGEYSLHLIEPVRDVFSCLFFAAIGLHGVHPSLLVREAGVLLLLTVVTVVFKFGVTCLIMMLVFRYDWRTASIISIGLSQISEFVFVLGSRAKGSGIISREVYYLLLGTTSLSMILSPLLWYLVGPKGQETKAYRVVGENGLPTYHGSPPPDSPVGPSPRSSMGFLGDVELSLRKDRRQA